MTGGWSGVEPSDRDGRENQEEQFARIEKTKLYLQDSGGTTRSRALCECDGKPIATRAGNRARLRAGSENFALPARPQF